MYKKALPNIGPWAHNRHTDKSTDFSQKKIKNQQAKHWCTKGHWLPPQVKLFYEFNYKPNNMGT